MLYFKLLFCRCIKVRNIIILGKRTWTQRASSSFMWPHLEYVTTLHVTRVVHSLIVLDCLWYLYILISYEPFALCFLLWPTPSCQTGHLVFGKVEVWSLDASMPHMFFYAPNHLLHSSWQTHRNRCILMELLQAGDSHIRQRKSPQSVCWWEISPAGKLQTD